MDAETKQILEENLRLHKENNILLQKLLRAERTRAIARYAYWAIIIVFTLGSLFFLKPLLGNVLNLYTGGGIDTNQNTNTAQMQDLLDSLK